LGSNHEWTNADKLFIGTCCLGILLAIGAALIIDANTEIQKLPENILAERWDASNIAYEKPYMDITHMDNCRTESGYYVCEVI